MNFRQGACQEGFWKKSSSLICTTVPFLFHYSIYNIIPSWKSWKYRGSAAYPSRFYSFQLPKKQHHPSYNYTNSTYLSQCFSRRFCGQLHWERSLGTRGRRYKKTTLTVFSRLIQSLLKTTGIFFSGAHRFWIRLCFTHFKTIPHSPQLLPVADSQSQRSEDPNGAKLLILYIYCRWDQHLQLQAIPRVFLI